MVLANIFVDQPELNELCGQHYICQTYHMEYLLVHARWHRLDQWEKEINNNKKLFPPPWRFEHMATRLTSK